MLKDSRSVSSFLVQRIFYVQCTVFHLCMHSKRKNTWSHHHTVSQHSVECTVHRCATNNRMKEQERKKTQALRNVKREGERDSEVAHVLYWMRTCLLYAIVVSLYECVYVPWRNQEDIALCLNGKKKAERTKATKRKKRKKK